MMCWNVCGWFKDGRGMEQMRESHDMRAEVIDFYKPDMMALVETWLKGEEEIVVEGYRWFGRNRRNLHRNAVRGSGGVGLLVREEVLERYVVEVLDTDVEDVLWVRLNQENEEILTLAVCYIPPEPSGSGMGAEETLQLLTEQVLRFGSQGPLIICGDFNARCGTLDVHREGVPPRKVIDVMRNSQGEDFVEFLKSVNMVVVNGRKGRDAFTCISGRGCSVVDYCVVGNEHLNMIESFKVTTMSESVEEMRCKGAVTRIPDHSLVAWEIGVDWVGEREEEVEGGVEKRFRVPEGYLESEVERVRRLRERVMAAGKDQVVIDEVYEELVKMMKQGRVEVKVRRDKRRQRWFTKEIGKLRKAFHEAEREWLKCGDKEAKKDKKREYVEKRRTYKRAVGRAKRSVEESKRNELDRLIRSPRRWWAAVRKLGLTDGRKKRSNISKVYDEAGVVKQGKEAVEVWRRHFKRVLNEGRSEGEGNGGGEEAGSGFELLNEAMTREEVEQALDSLKRKVAPGSDGLTAEMVGSKVLVDFWVTLFNWCWREGMVPSEWRRSTVVPIPKKGGSGVCQTDEFRGISLVPVAYKAMCSVVQGRLEHVVGERDLVAEEQGGFRKGRGCRDQLLTLVLLGQVRAVAKRGMMAGFIDFKKAYDRVSRGKLWCSLEEMGIRGKVIDFLKAVYSDMSCVVKVGEEWSEPFGVSCGLRQGCILSPLLFSLYVNSLVSKLKGAEVGVKCGDQLISVLMYADDAVIVAEDEKSMKRGLETLAEWCNEWAVEINVEKCGVMHMRRKGVRRTDKKFYVRGEEVRVVEEYKYLGCVVNEHLQSVRMVEERAKAGAGALGDWLRRCRATVGEVKGATFMKLMEMLVETVLLYGAEVWGCGGQLRPVENVQMRAARIFLGVGRLHPLVALQYEMNMLPVKWEAMKRSIEFWVQVMRMGDGRLLKVVMMEALERGSKVKWVKDLWQSLEMFGWKEVDVEALNGLTMREVKQMLKDVAWRKVREVWREEARVRSKLGMMGRLMDDECKSRCVEVDCKRQRRMLAKLRGGTAELRIETGRWRGLKREERICKNCRSGEVEDAEHLVMKCELVKEERGKLLELMDERVEGWQGLKEIERMAVTLDRACSDSAVGRAVERIWRRRFMA